MEHEIEFKNGHLFCTSAPDGYEEDMMETFDLFAQMEAYYNSNCVVKHWRQRTMDSGEYVESTMTVRDAILQIKEGWLERASFVPA